MPSAHKQKQFISACKYVCHVLRWALGTKERKREDVSSSLKVLILQDEKYDLYICGVYWFSMAGNKLSQTEWLKTPPIYYLTISVSEKVGHNLEDFSDQSFTRLQSRCWLGSFSSGGQTTEKSTSNFLTLLAELIFRNCRIHGSLVLQSQPWRERERERVSAASNL